MSCTKNFKLHLHLLFAVSPDSRIENYRRPLLESIGDRDTGTLIVSVSLQLMHFSFVFLLICIYVLSLGSFLKHVKFRTTRCLPCRMKALQPASWHTQLIIIKLQSTSPFIFIPSLNYALINFSAQLISVMACCAWVFWWSRSQMRIWKPWWPRRTTFQSCCKYNMADLEPKWQRAPLHCALRSIRFTQVWVWGQPHNHYCLSRWRHSGSVECIRCGTRARLPAALYSHSFPLGSPQRCWVSKDVFTGCKPTSGSPGCSDPGTKSCINTWRLRSLTAKH